VSASRGHCAFGAGASEERRVSYALSMMRRTPEMNPKKVNMRSIDVRKANARPFNCEAKPRKFSRQAAVDGSGSSVVSKPLYCIVVIFIV